MPRHDDLVDNPAYQLWLATNAWQRQLRKALTPLGLTHVQYMILASISKLGGHGEVVTQRDVCEFASMDANMVSQVVRSLAAKGYVERAEHNDRRARKLLLTEAGDALLARGRAVARPLTAAFFEPLGKQQAPLARMLAVIVEAAD
jgi:DNA-binding MarR family transcriptional regulator